jgi:hypothetical protein
VYPPIAEPVNNDPNDNVCLLESVHVFATPLLKTHPVSLTGDPDKPQEDPLRQVTVIPFRTPAPPEVMMIVVDAAAYPEKSTSGALPPS